MEEPCHADALHLPSDVQLCWHAACSPLFPRPGVFRLHTPLPDNRANMLPWREPGLLHHPSGGRKSRAGRGCQGVAPPPPPSLSPTRRHPSSPLTVLAYGDPAGEPGCPAMLSCHRPTRGSVQPGLECTHTPLSRKRGSFQNPTTTPASHKHTHTHRPPTYELTPLDASLMLS